MNKYNLQYLLIIIIIFVLYKIVYIIFIYTYIPFKLKIENRKNRI